VHERLGCQDNGKWQRGDHDGPGGGEGSAWLRWVLNQAAQTAKRSPEFAATYSNIAKRRGKKIATIAIARKLPTRAWHLLADMQATDTTTPLLRP